MPGPDQAPAPPSARGNLLRWTPREKRAFLSVLAVAAIVFGVWGFGSTTLQTVDFCRTCNSSRTTSQWGLGDVDGRAFLAMGTEIVVGESDLLHLLPPEHGHDWDRESFSTTVFGSRRALGCNMRRAHPVAVAFQDRYPFRLLLEAKIGSRELSREDLAAMAALPREAFGSVGGDPGRRAHVERVRALFQVTGVNPEPDWQSLFGE